MEVIIQLKEELERTRSKLMAMEQKEKDNEIIRLSYQYEADEMGLQSGRANNSIVFSWLFVKKIIDLPGGKLMTPHRGVHCSLLFLPPTPSSWSWTLEGLFKLK